MNENSSEIRGLIILISLNYYSTAYKILVHCIHECNIQITWQLAARLYTKWISFKSHVEEELRSKPFRRR